MGNLVEIAQFYDPEEAYCAKGLLRSHGINVIVQNEHHLTVAPSLRFALGGYRLLAPSKFEDDAKHILNAVSESSSVENDIFSAWRNETTDIPEQKTRNWFWLPIAFAWGVPFIPARRSGWIEVFEMTALICLYTTILVSIVSWFV